MFRRRQCLAKTFDATFRMVIAMTTSTGRGLIPLLAATQSIIFVFLDKNSLKSVYV